jgi:lipocalin
MKEAIVPWTYLASLQKEGLKKCPTAPHRDIKNEKRKPSVTADSFATRFSSFSIHSYSFHLSNSARLCATICYLLIMWSSSWSDVGNVSFSVNAARILPDNGEEDTTSIHRKRYFVKEKSATATATAVRVRRTSNSTSTTTTTTTSTTTSTTTTNSFSVTCPVVNTVPDFEIEQYAARPWYSHQQAANVYLPIELNYCVRAEYNVRDRPTFPWGYTVDVRNQAQDENGNPQGGNLCAYQTDLESGQPGKLAVAPCFLPKTFAGPYWVLLYNEDEGYALISGGQPNVPSYDKDGNFIGCRTGRGINDSGLWIFSRSPVRDQELIDSVRARALEMGMDVTVLNDVNQVGCYDDDADDDGGNEVLVPTPVPSTVVSTQPTEKDQEEQEDDDEQLCMDSAEPFRLWFDIFGTEQDCDWVKQRSWWRCIFYNDFCPKTCGDCSGD